MQFYAKAHPVQVLYLNTAPCSTARPIKPYNEYVWRVESDEDDNDNDYNYVNDDDALTPRGTPSPSPYPSPCIVSSSPCTSPLSCICALPPPAIAFPYELPYTTDDSDDSSDSYESDDFDYSEYDDGLDFCTTNCEDASGTSSTYGVEYMACISRRQAATRPLRCRSYTI